MDIEAPRKKKKNSRFFGFFFFHLSFKKCKNFGDLPVPGHSDTTGDLWFSYVVTSVDPSFQQKYHTKCSALQK